jgi:RNA polymerase sigma factor (sigma-70 family)
MVYSDLESRSHLKSTYKRGKRKFQILTLNDPKYITFLEFFSDFRNNKTPESRLDLFTNVINKGDKAQYSKELFYKSFYEKYPLESNLNESNYLLYRDNLLENYENWQTGWKNIPAEASEEQKASTLVEFMDKLNEMFRIERGKPEFSLFLKEAESVYILCFELFFVEMLFELQKIYNLTEKEVKLYRLMYTRQKYFDDHIPKLERLLVEFYKTLSKEDKALLIFAVLNDEPDSVVKHLRGKYQNKLTNFLKMYPIWLEIVQMDEALDGEKKHLILSKENRIFYEMFAKENWRLSYKIDDPDNPGEKKEIFVTIKYIHDEIPGSEDGLLFEEVIPNPNAEGPDILVIKKEIIEQILPKAIEALTPKQKTVIQRMYFDNKTEKQIAEEEGVAQSAISQRKHAGLRSMAKFINSST